MADKHIFISYSTSDAGFVDTLSRSLEELGIFVWVDSQSLRGGSTLHKKIAAAIENAAHTIVVLSPNTVNSSWVREEIAESLRVEKKRRDGYRTIPILLPGINETAIPLWFGEERKGIAISLETGDVQNALHHIMAAIGREMPSKPEEIDIAARPCAELLLELSDPEVKTEAGDTWACGTARIVFASAEKGEPRIGSKRFAFRSPVGPIEFQEINWYLEDYFRWPHGVFAQRAEQIEEKLPIWGKALYDAVFDHKETDEAVRAWKNHADTCDLRFSVTIDQELMADATDDGKTRAAIGATELLSIPWELLHNGKAYLLSGAHPVGIKRQLPNLEEKKAIVSKLPIRVLLVSARPEDARAGYIDHRVSALPLINAVENLGDLVSVKVLSPATFPAMIEEIKQAYEKGEEYRYDVIHFDGHGVFDEQKGLGALCFEDPGECGKLYNRKSALVYAKEIAEYLYQYRIPLVFLEACQTAKTEKKPEASVAAALLEGGVSSVIAMTHSVLVETATRFVEKFYTTIAKGRSVSSAVLDARLALSLDKGRSTTGAHVGACGLKLHDWFVPVLFQEENDPRLFPRIPAKESAHLIRQKQKTSLGNLAAIAEKRNHRFVGRSRELLALERLLAREKYATVRGQGGAGKTTIAVEAAAWLVRSGRFKKGAFLSVENLIEIRSLVDDLGRQLISGYSVAGYATLEDALQPICRVLREYPVIIVIDNMESMLPDQSNKTDPSADDDVKELFDLCTTLLSADDDETTRIVFTTREKLFPPFGTNEIELGALSKNDAIELVSDILKQKGTKVPENDYGETPEQIDDLVIAVNCHARALVLLTNELAERGLKPATKEIQRLMVEMERRYPGNREKSLYASLELSLQRLAPETRQQLPVLALFHNGVHLDVLATLLQIEPEQAQALGFQLIAAGLAENRGYGHISLDPSLPAYMLTRIGQADFEQKQKQWAEAMLQLTNYLYEQRFKDTQIAAQLAILELFNLLALLDYVEEHNSPEAVAATAGSVEQLIADLHKPKAIKKVVGIREKAQFRLQDKEWSHAAFEAERMAIDRLLSQGNLQAAFDAAQKLLARSIEEGENAYSGANYNIAMAHFSFGRILSLGGNSEQALDFLEQAQMRFQTIAETGNESAERMAAVCLAEKADCLAALGRLDDAALAYEEGLKISEQLEDKRQIAVIKGQLGTLRMLQKQYEEAVALYRESKDIFEQLREYQSVAVMHHQIGMVYEQTGNFTEAERAYKDSLAIKIKINDKAGEAQSMGQLGNLYQAHGFLEEAVKFFRHACDIAVTLKDILVEGKQRNNLADTLIKLKRFDHAREEILKAIACKSHFGHAAEPWTAFGILYDLETATGHPEAAIAAWQKAFDAYLSYRKDGGYGKSQLAQVAAMALEGIKSRNTAELKKLLKQAAKANLPEADRLFFSKLASILKGSRELTLAKDTGLFFMDAVELYLVVEGL